MNSDAPYPVQYSVDYPDRPLNRLSTFFRLFMVIPIAIVTSGLMRNRRWFSNKAFSGTMDGGLRNRPTTSVQVTGKFFPARI